MQQVTQRAGSLWNGIKQTAGALAVATLPYTVAQPAQAVPIASPTQAQQQTVAGGDVFNIVINTHDGQSSPQEIAQIVRREIEAVKREQGRTMRSRLRDND
ncbi:hypothetical protein [Hafnia alvei]|uniref:hypothetical protein n=1 Tax=Hafnia alvei TaxID=569 RepID=UPI001E62BBFE|nr:hypothetical protein [Hafnia alvei]